MYPMNGMPEPTGPDQVLIWTGREWIWSDTPVRDTVKHRLRELDRRAERFLRRQWDRLNPEVPVNPLREYDEECIDGNSWSRPAHPDQRRGEGAEI